MAKQDELEKIRVEIESIKRLMIFVLLEQGKSQAKIASALGISQASVSRMFSRSTGKETA